MAWLQRLKNTIFRSRHERALDEEIGFHFDQRVDEYIRRGMSAGDARREALRRLGNLTLIKDETRDTDTLVRFGHVSQDVRYAIRLWRKSPGFVAAALCSLALAIGASTAIFSVINALVFRNLPVRDPEHLVVFREDDGPAVPGYESSYSLFEKVRRRTELFESVATIGLVDRSDVTLSGTGGGADGGPVRVSLVSGPYFSMLGIGAANGRVLTVDDDRLPGGHPVAVLSDDYWNRLGRATDVVGRRVSLNGMAFTIVGIAAPGFTGDWVGRPTDLWIPKMMQAQVIPEYPSFATGGLLRIVARLKAGVSASQAQAGVQADYQRDLREGWPNPSASQTLYLARARIVLTSAGRGYAPYRESFGPFLTILAMMVGVVLIIACANVASLLLARADARRREIAVRLAIGASRARLVRQMLTESLLLATLATALGLILSIWGATALAAAIGSGPVPLDSRMTAPALTLDLRPDASVFLFTATICFMSGILFGLAPAFRGSGVALASALSDRSAAPAAGGRFRIGRVLVVAQVALSLMILVGAILLVQTLRNLRAHNLGFDRHHVLLVWTAPGRTGRQGPALATLIQAVRDRVAALPGVLAVSASNHGFLEGWDTGGGSEMMPIEGHEPQPGLATVRIAATPGFFAASGMTLVAGRDLSESDNESAPRVAVVNQRFARFFFGDANPLGKRFGRGTGDMTEIVGVVGDAMHGTPRDRRGVFYVPYRQYLNLMRTLTIEVRTAGPPAALAGLVRATIRTTDPNIPVVRIDTVEEQLRDVLSQERLVAMVATFFGIVALLLACMGVHGVIAYTTARRSTEIGIRMALGARRQTVVSMILRDSLVLVGTGLVIGVPLTMAATRAISQQLFDVRASGVSTIVWTSCLLIGLGTAAAFVPARRASCIDPLAALRSD